MPQVGIDYSTEREPDFDEIYDKPSIGQQLDRVEKSVIVLRETIQELHEHLSPLIGPDRLKTLTESPRGSIKGAEDSLTASEFTNRVWRNANQLEMLITQVRNLNTRVEI